MKRKYLLGAIISGTALLGLPAVALAQNAPPSPPVMLVYGKVNGGAVGQGVIAIVSDGTKSAVCGATTTISDGGQVVYAIDVLADSQIKGCGVAGRTVRFYITPTTPTQGGKLANESLTIPSGFQAKAQDLTPGTALGNLHYGVHVASDKTN